MIVKLAKICIVMMNATEILITMLANFVFKPVRL